MHHGIDGVIGHPKTLRRAFARANYVSTIRCRAILASPARSILVRNTTSHLVYIYIYVYMYTCTYVHMYIRIYVNMYVNMYTCMYVYMHFREGGERFENSLVGSFGDMCILEYDMRFRN